MQFRSSQKRFRLSYYLFQVDYKSQFFVTDLIDIYLYDTVINWLFYK